MPLCPQITNTPVVLPRQVAITAVSYTTTTATYTASGHTFVAGNVVVITGLLPAGYNGTFTISSVSGSTTFTVPNSTNAALTDQSGLATPGGDYVITSVLPVVPATTTQVNAAQSSATAAAAAAAAASAIAATAVQVSANTIVNASNQLTAINGTGITVYSGASSTSGARVVLNSLGLAGYNTGGSATFAISASTGTVQVTGGILSGGSITGTQINVPTVGSPAFSVNALGEMTATSANITGTITATSGTISGALTITGSLTGGTIQTSSGTNAVVLDGANNALGVKSGGSFAGWIASIGSGSVLMHYGTSPSSTAYPRTAASAGAATVSGTASSGFSANNDGTNGITGNTNHFAPATFSSTVNLNGQANYSGVATGSGSTMVLVTTGSRIAYTTSSERFKQDIVYINTPGWLDKVMAMKPITYKTSEDFTVEGEPNETQYGFLAEDIYDLGGGLEKAVVLDPLGEPFSLSYDRLTVFLTLAIKELKAEIDQLKGE